MGVVGGLGLVVHHPGTGQPTPSWSKPDACIALCCVLSGKQPTHLSTCLELSTHTAAARRAASTAISVID